MDIASLKYFIEITKDMNITEAAKRLFVSQQSLSQHVQKLEQYYGVSLFYRKPRLSLTPEGEQLLDSAQKIIAAEDDLMNRLKDTSGNCYGTLRLGIPTYRAQICLPAILPDFHVKWPNVTIRLAELPSQEMEQMILDGTLDLYVGILNEYHAKIKVQTLMFDDVYVVVPDHVLYKYFGDETESFKQKARRGADLKDFKTIPFMLGTRPNRLRKAADACFREAGYQPYVYLESSNTDFLISLYPNNFGAMFLSRMGLPLLRKVIDETNIFPLLYQGEFFKYKVVAGYHSDRHLPEYARDFINMLLALTPGITI